MREAQGFSPERKATRGIEIPNNHVIIEITVLVFLIIKRPYPRTAGKLRSVDINPLWVETGNQA